VPDKLHLCKKDLFMPRAWRPSIGGGKLFYFPNIVLTMLRPNASMHAQNVAQFHVPLSMTKPAIRNYLARVYGLVTTDVRTANFLGNQKRDLTGRRFKTPDWKKAIVSFKEPFVYPPAPDMDKEFNPEERKAEKERALKRARTWRRRGAMDTSVTRKQMDADKDAKPETV
jgi:ribosomal protein L23